jgi:hypothetical protein
VVVVAAAAAAVLKSQRRGLSGSDDRKSAMVLVMQREWRLFHSHKTAAQLMGGYRLTAELHMSHILILK